MAEQTVRVVTHEQYGRGYTVIKINEIPNTEQKPFKLIRKLPDGNYLVENPMPTNLNNGDSDAKD